KNKVRQLLRTCRMGDEKPSHFLQRMRSMVKKNVLDSVLKTIFLEKVPQSLYDVLVVNPDADLITLVLLVARVMKFWSSHIASMSRSNVATSVQSGRIPKGRQYNDDFCLATQSGRLRRTCLDADHFNDDLDLNLAVDDLHYDSNREKQRILLLSFQLRRTSIPVQNTVHVFIDDGHCQWKHRYGCATGGKLKARPTVLTTLEGVQSSRLVIYDRKNRLSFLIDSRDDISVLPLSSTKGNVVPSDFKVYAADGMPISTYGVRILTLDLGATIPQTEHYCWEYF
ncbi:hypothetical protein WN51_11883, partial [Melipona quadrifasciata]